MMSYITPRFITLACIITMLFGAYLGMPCNKPDHKEGRHEIDEVRLDASPSAHFNTQTITPLRDAKPLTGGLDRRQMGMAHKGPGAMNPPAGGQSGPTSPK